MLKSFISWLDHFIIDEGPSTVAKAVVGILGFAALLGAILGNAAVKAGLIVSVILLALVGIVVLIGDRKRLKQEAEYSRRLLARYCNFLTDRPKPVVRVLDWEQIAVIESNGDTVEVVTLRALVLRDELYFLPLRLGPGWDQPQKYRQRVQVKVRSLSVDGTKGTSCDITTSWLPDGRMDVLSHLSSPVGHGSEVRLEMEWRWPGKCIPLAKERRPDEFAFRFNNPVERASYVVVLPAGEDAYFDPSVSKQTTQVSLSSSLEIGKGAQNLRSSFTMCDVAAELVSDLN